MRAIDELEAEKDRLRSQHLDNNRDIIDVLLMRDSIISPNQRDSLPSEEQKEAAEEVSHFNLIIFYYCKI